MPFDPLPLIPPPSSDNHDLISFPMRLVLWFRFCQGLDGTYRSSSPSGSSPPGCFTQHKALRSTHVLANAL